jgi:large subunit ribosomal protein L2
MKKYIIWRYKPVNKLTLAINKGSGRNNQGVISTWHRSSIKRRFRNIDTRRRLAIPFRVIRVERDPNRSAPIALILYHNGLLSYILSPEAPDEQIYPMLQNNFQAGVSGKILYVPTGTFIHNVEININSGGQYVRVGGGKAQIIRKNNVKSVIKLPSGEVRSISNNCYVTCGIIQNSTALRIKTNLHKAGQNRWIGKKPIVRGVAMNPIDHPHGGGEGKSSGGRVSCSPWGILTKGFKTRHDRKSFSNIVVTRSGKKIIHKY